MSDKALEMLDEFSTKISDVFYQEMDKINYLRHEIRRIIENTQSKIVNIVLKNK